MSADPSVNRELWWLEGNCALLDEARDPAVPPLARLRSLGAVSANLDEFFMGRVPALERLARDRARVARRVRELVDDQRRGLEALRAPLDRSGVVVLQPSQLTRRQRAVLEERFLATILPILTPLAVGPGHRFPFLGNRSLALLVSARPAVASALPHSERSIIHIPSEALPRCIAVPDARRPHAFMLLEDVVRLHLPTICHGYDIVSSHAIRVTRQIGAADRPARGRWRGMAVRLQIDGEAPPAVLALLREALRLSDDEIHAGSGIVALSALLELHAAVTPPRRGWPWRPTRPSTVAFERAIAARPA
jgi:polyphosphate kinase